MYQIISVVHILGMACVKAPSDTTFSRKLSRCRDNFMKIGTLHDLIQGNQDCFKSLTITVCYKYDNFVH